MDPNNNQPSEPQNYPAPEPMSTPPQQNNLNPNPVQPGVTPPAQQPMSQSNEHTDVLGIISLVMIIVAPLIGVIIGAIGMSKAKKEGYKNTLSKIGLIINLILTILGFLFVILWIFVFAAFSNEVSNISTEIENQSQIASEQDPLDATDASFVVTSQRDIGGICESKGWPSNVTASADGNIVGLYSNRSSFPDIYSTQYASLDNFEDVDFDNPTVVDTVVCLTSVDQTPIDTVTCKLEVDDVEVDAPMYRRPFSATAYSVANKAEIASFTVQPESDCPFFVSVNPDDNSFDARLDEDSLELELNKVLQ